MSADKKLTEMRRREATRKKRPTVMYGAQKKRFSEQVGDGAERAQCLRGRAARRSGSR